MAQNKHAHTETKAGRKLGGYVTCHKVNRPPDTGWQRDILAGFSHIFKEVRWYIRQNAEAAIHSSRQDGPGLLLRVRWLENGRDHSGSAPFPGTRDSDMQPAHRLTGLVNKS
jgi:hypothetical protein